MNHRQGENPDWVCFDTWISGHISNIQNFFNLYKNNFFDHWFECVHFLAKIAKSLTSLNKTQTFVFFKTAYVLLFACKISGF